MKMKIAITIACILVVLLLIAVKQIRNKEHSDEIKEDVYNTMEEAISLEPIVE